MPRTYGRLYRFIYSTAVNCNDTLRPGCKGRTPLPIIVENVQISNCVFENHIITRLCSVCLFVCVHEILVILCLLCGMDQREMTDVCQPEKQKTALGMNFVFPLQNAFITVSCNTRQLKLFVRDLLGTGNNAHRLSKLSVVDTTTLRCVCVRATDCTRD